MLNRTRAFSSLAVDVNSIGIFDDSHRGANIIFSISGFGNFDFDFGFFHRNNGIIYLLSNYAGLARLLRRCLAFNLESSLNLLLTYR